MHRHAGGKDWIFPGPFQDHVPEFVGSLKGLGHAAPTCLAIQAAAIVPAANVRGLHKLQIDGLLAPLVWLNIERHALTFGETAHT